MTPQTMVIWIGGVFSFVVVGVVVLFILDIFWNGSTGIFTSGSYAANATAKASSGIYNVFDQLTNVGKLAGVSLIIGVLALMGLGGYALYQRSRTD